MKGYDAWLTTDRAAEETEAEAEQIIEHGMPYFEVDLTWGRDQTGRIVWSCEFCGGLHECKETCWTREYAETDGGH